MSRCVLAFVWAITAVAIKFIELAIRSTRSSSIAGTAGARLGGMFP
ncbi:hypothetical protein A2U01_0116897, partial [Trifolium medium]|nr:hypothetical protein [Trifolium medium]